MLENLNSDCTCWSQLATSASVDVYGIFQIGYTQQLVVSVQYIAKWVCIYFGLFYESGP